MPDLWEKKSDHGEGGWGSSSNSTNAWSKSSNGSWSSSSNDNSGWSSSSNDNSGWSSSSNDRVNDSSNRYSARINENPENQNLINNIERYNQRRVQSRQNEIIKKVALIIGLLFFLGPLVGGLITYKLHQVKHRSPVEGIRAEMIKHQNMVLEKKAQQLEEETRRLQADARQRNVEIARQRSYDEQVAEYRAKQFAERQRQTRTNNASSNPTGNAEASPKKKFSGYTKKELLTTIVAQTGVLKQEVLKNRLKELQQTEASEKERRKHIDYEKKMLSMPDYDIQIESKQWEHMEGNQAAKAEYENDFLAINESFIQTDFAFCLSHDPAFSSKAKEYRLTLLMTPNRQGINILDLKEIYPDGDKDIDAGIISCFSTLTSALYAPKPMSKSSTLTLTLSANKINEQDKKSQSNEDNEGDRHNTRNLKIIGTFWAFPKSLTEQMTNEEYEFLFGEKLDTLKHVIKNCSKDHDAPERFKLTLAIAPQGGPIYITSTNYSNVECLYQNKELNMMKNTVNLKFSTTASVSINYALGGM